MKPIAHYENRYNISENGLILNKANNHLLQWRINPNGYAIVSLANGDGTKKQFSVHRLVALHYLPNPYQYPQVNHKDGNKLNNDRQNLEWCTAQNNIQHAFKTGLRPGYLSADDKEQYLYQVIKGKSIQEIAQQIERHPNTLHKMLRITAKRLKLTKLWSHIMKQRRRNAAIRNLAKINN